MAEEKLIEAVRKHQELYDTKHPDYMKTKFKRRIWNDIAKDLNLKDGKEAKITWLKLRGSYRDARRRQLKYLKSGVPAENIKIWRYQNQMSFLEQVMSAGSHEGNLSDDSDYSSKATTTTPVGNDILEIEGNYSIKNEESEETQDTDNDDDNVVSSRSKGTDYVTHDTATSSPVMQRQQSKKRKQDDAVILLQQSTQQREGRARQRAEESRPLEPNLITDDPLYNFFISMYQLTKNMPQCYQHRIRGQLFQAVSLAEEEIMKSSQPPYSNSSP